MRVFLLLLPLLLASQEWQRDFEAQWQTGDAETQRAAVAGLAGRGEPEVVTLLVRTATRLDRQIERLHKQKRRLAERMRKIPADSLVTPGGELIDRPGYERRKALDRESKRVEAQLVGHDATFSAFETVVARLTSEAAVARACQQAREARSPRLRFHLVRGLAGLSGAPARKALESAVRDRSGPVAVAALDALSKRPESIDAVIGGLEQDPWQVRLAATRALEEIDSVAGIAPLLAAMKRADGRLRREINDALVALTGENKHGDLALWEAWWQELGEGFSSSRPAREKRAERAVQARAGSEGHTTFYGLDVPTKRVIFVLDRSGSMAGESRWRDDGRTPTGAEPRLEGGRKIDVCRFELKQVLAALAPDARFAVMFYNRDLRRFPARGLAPASQAAIKKAGDFMDSVEPLGATNVFDSLEAAMAAESWEDQVDTIFVLSDGVPNCGRFEATAAICAEIRRRNAQSRIIINTVLVGTGAAARELMQQLAEQNGGRFVDRSG